jgi:hypothetical protein
MSLFRNAGQRAIHLKSKVASRAGCIAAGEAEVTYALAVMAAES